MTRHTICMLSSYVYADQTRAHAALTTKPFKVSSDASFLEDNSNWQQLLIGITVTLYTYLALTAKQCSLLHGSHR